MNAVAGGRITCCANKLGGGWEREKIQQAAKRHNNDGHGEDIGSRLLLLAAAVVAARALPCYGTALEGR